ncbi:MAG: methylated-DNA--[protein]-cysteine S-methyltransferase [Candidatus Eremiobacteraeota bacterium]|nr:methylated-DNA--[protein]-cysteine S-methyltransferase [Candidatus Eremiobacteraeota bacterium]MBV9701060.1 methylated-DNA--[protein]-cysteine S-methyltransferase [Candidatus Eremiobacteraeota bacterium]
MIRSALDTPVGTLQVAVDRDGALVEILLPNRSPRGASEAPSRAAARGMDRAKQQLAEYFSRRRRAFDLTLQPAGSPFEQLVWSKLLEIPYGITTSYGAIADELQLRNGARAVGHANGANPIPIVIPCHRVIGSDGRLTGYGGGLSLKRRLLELEGAIGLPPPRLF